MQGDRREVSSQHRSSSTDCRTIISVLSPVQPLARRRALITLLFIPHARPALGLNLFTACSPECIIGARPTIDRPVDSAPAQVEVPRTKRGIHEREPPSALVRLVDIWLPLCPSSHGSALRCCHNVRWYVNVFIKMKIIATNVRNYRPFLTSSRDYRLASP